MSVECRNEQSRPFRQEDLCKAARRCLSAMGCRSSTVSIYLVDDEKMRRIHRRFLQTARTTDVLSFPQDPVGQVSLLGDVVISVEAAARRSPKNVEGEATRYLVHGLLHLIGFDHKRPADRRVMRRESRRLARLCGMGR